MTALHMSMDAENILIWGWEGPCQFTEIASVPAEAGTRYIRSRYSYPSEEDLNLGAMAEVRKDPGEYL